MSLWQRLRRWLGIGSAPDLLALVADGDPRRVRVIVGLGNPGPKYARTRHNVGFEILDRLAERLGGAWSSQASLKADVAVGTLDDLTVVLAKPTTFMNASGEAIAALIERTHTPLDQLLVVYDDMDLPLGTLRLRARGGPGTHNGMRSVVSSLDDTGFARLRVGISQAGRTKAIDHVLGEFDPEEAPVVDAAIDRAVEATQLWACDGPEVAANKFNG